MGIYDKRRSIPRKDLKSVFRKDTGAIPETGGRKYYNRERAGMTKDTFGAKYGSEISKDEYRKVIRDLQSAGRKAKTPTERLRINRKINYLKRLGGKNI